MNAYRLIRVSPRYHRLTPLITRDLHIASVAWLRTQLREPHPGPTVVVTHHAPSTRSVAPHLVADPLTAAYASDLEWLLEGSDVAVWVHGHTHHAADYLVGGTHVICNPRGYASEGVRGFDPGCVLDVPTPAPPGVNAPTEGRRV